MVSEAQKRANARYRKKSVTKVVTFYPTDRDIIDHVKAMGEPFATYVKRLIREDMAKSV